MEKIKDKVEAFINEMKKFKLNRNKNVIVYGSSGLGKTSSFYKLDKDIQVKEHSQRQTER